MAGSGFEDGQGRVTLQVTPADSRGPGLKDPDVLPQFPHLKSPYSLGTWVPRSVGALQPLAGSFEGLGRAQGLPHPTCIQGATSRVLGVEEARGQGD